jgi:hypothetical protein
MGIQSIIHREPRPCIVLELRCEHHGPVRLAVAPEDAAEHLPCPYCGVHAPTAKLGEGSTRRILPYFDLAPDARQLDRLQSLPGAGRPLISGAIVCFAEQPDVFHLAKVHDVYTNRANVSAAGLPSITFLLEGDESDPVPHISGAEGAFPWWCWPDELPSTGAEPITPTPATVISQAKADPIAWTCPKCDAPAGQGCTNRNGVAMAQPHIERKLAGKEA